MSVIARFIVYGQAASKANSRRLIWKYGKPKSIKSKAALRFVREFDVQCPQLNEVYEGDVHVKARIYYASRRPDLDESLILDGMQGKIYRNDRQVKKKTIEWGLDRDRPRACISVETYIPDGG